MRQLLLEGAVYALENSAALLRDAAALHERGSYANAIVMAMFGREELGKYRMLREKYEVVATGGTVDVKELTDKSGFLFKHIEKQKQAVLSVIQRPEPGTRLDQLLRARFNLTPGTREWAKTEQELEELTEAMAKELPKKRHDLRMGTLYVGLNDDQTRWIRPQEVKAKEARDEVLHAICDYNVVQSRLEDTIDDKCAFSIAYYSWVDRPQISAVSTSRLGF